MQKIEALLEKIRDSFPEKARKVAKTLARAGMSKEEIGSLEQKIEPPEPIKKGIPTLKPAGYRKPSPMTEERFKFAGTWTQIDRVWLGIGDMEKELKKKKTQQLIKALKENWDGSAPAVFPPERLSLFAIVEGAEENQTYLVWPEKEGEEPQIWNYFGQSETKYKSLQKYLEHVLKD